MSLAKNRGRTNNINLCCYDLTKTEIPASFDQQKILLIRC